jgi:putative methyltransferase (TIGR04325 family)
MGVFDLWRQRTGGLLALAGMQRWRKAAYDRQFETARAGHLFRGIYDSFDAARRDAPVTAPLGYDNTASTDLYIGWDNAQAHDYPAFFWLAQSIAERAESIVDLGGNIGTKFVALRSLLALPPQLRWLVIDVPEVVRRAEQLRRQEGSSADPRCHFSADYGDIDGTDVLYASGALQYLPMSLHDMLAGLRLPPKRIVVNTTPIHATKSFFTLNSIGSAYCPYRVQSRREFVQGVEALGYELRDTWLNPGKSMRIPFETGYDISDYSGFCFDRNG